MHTLEAITLDAAMVTNKWQLCWQQSNPFIKKT